MFNAYVWKLYCDSSLGRHALNKAFPRFARFARRPGSENWRDQLNAVVPILVENLQSPEEPWVRNGEIPLRGLLSDWFADHGNDNIETAFLGLLEGDGLFCFWDDEAFSAKRFWVGFGGDELPDEVASQIGVVSSVLHWRHPEKFIPYYFEGKFRLFCNLCQEFGIPLPEIPGKLQKKERSAFYLEINKVLQEFRRANDLTPKELNAFLYDFAPAFLKADEDNELPLPRQAWFLMAGAGTEVDFDFLDQSDASSESLWRGHRDAQRGDIAVLWCASPRAHLHSIWRVVEDGTDDPFSHWYSLVRVGRPVPVPHLKLKALKANPVLAKSPMVRAHFQGCAGKYFPSNDYLALLDECEKHGANLSQLPKLASLTFPALSNGNEIGSEREVEQELIEPLLSRLGYEPDRHWQRQVRVRMGRGEKFYPDYVIGLRGAVDQERADVVVESKFRIATRKDLQEAFRQGRSYAVRLRARTLILAALEGIWVISDDGEFSLASARQWNWLQLADEVCFQQLREHLQR